MGAEVAAPEEAAALDVAVSTLASGALAGVMQPQPPSKPQHGESRGAFKRRMAEEQEGKRRHEESTLPVVLVCAAPDEWAGATNVDGRDGKKSATPTSEQFPDIRRQDQHRHDEQRAADRLTFVRAVRAGVVREGIERDSARVGSVTPGEVLEVLEVQTSREGRRRIRTARGWMSARAASGKALLVPSSEQERAAREAAGQMLPAPNPDGTVVGSSHKRRRRKKQERRRPDGLVVIEDSAEARLMHRRQRRQTARDDAPWRQPAPPLIRRDVAIISHPVRHLRHMSFGRGTGQFNTPRSLNTQDFRSLYDTGVGSTRGRRRFRTICTYHI